MPHATCPTDATHTTFVTTAHVVQEWLVDQQGQFLEERASAIETTSDPTSDRLWSCDTCGATATVSDVAPAASTS